MISQTSRFVQRYTSFRRIFCDVRGTISPNLRRTTIFAPITPASPQYAIMKSTRLSRAPPTTARVVRIRSAGTPLSIRNWRASAMRE